MIFDKETYRLLLENLFMLKYLNALDSLIVIWLKFQAISKSKAPSQDKTITIDSPAQEVNLTTHIPEGL